MRQKTIALKCNKDGTARMDPHFTTFSGDRFDYHGECHIALLQNPGYRQGMFLDIHLLII